MEIVPIYCIPMTGGWIKGKSKLGKTVYNSNRKALLLGSVHTFETQTGNVRIRYILPSEVSFYHEPKTLVFDEFFSKVRTGRITAAEALKILRDYQERVVDKELLRASFRQAMKEGRIPLFDLKEPEPEQEIPDFAGERFTGLNGS